MSTLIKRVHAREVFDSRGRPTVEVEITCTGGESGRAIAPSGASKGRFEALELRDHDPSRLGGAGVLLAVRNIETVIAPALEGLDAADQAGVDKRLKELDGTQNCSKLGANALVAVSLAAAHAAAAARRIMLVEHLHELWVQTAGAAGPGRRTVLVGREMAMPLPMVNMISGGLHAGKNLDFQDFLILPVGASSYHQALDWIVTIYHQLGECLTETGFEGVLVGDEGGFGPRLAENSRAVEVVLEAIERCRLSPGRDVAIGLDVAATHLAESTGRAQGYRLAASGGALITSAEIIDLFDTWTKKYPIVSIEDPLHESDSEWPEITKRLSQRVQLIGDDLFVTNPERFRTISAEGAANSVLIKVNQIGTLSETLATMRLALEADYWPVISARSGETEDATIADLAVATGAGQIKIGSVARSERLAKYNQLLRLEERLGSRAAWHGGKIFEALK
ncbi:MAG: phosphopyruvate hydratase [Planctomycetia bacterium]|nr:phosphopyruvate hydratase [Planctomycetia bacterium]